MHRLFAAILFGSLSVASLLAAPSDAALQMMKNIAHGTSRIEALTFPRPDVRVDREVLEFNDVARGIERNLAELDKLDPKARDSDADIWGKPFAAQLQAALATIETNRARLRAITAEQSKRDAEAKAAADAALAQQLAQKRVAAEKEEAEIIAARERQFARDKAAKAAWVKMREQAKASGYSDAAFGIVGVVQEVRDGVMSLDTAKALLIYADPDDEMEVQSIVGGNAIYVTQVSREDLVQVAIAKSKDVLYGKGTPLMDGSYAITGKASFRTVLGVETELLTLKRVQ